MLVFLDWDRLINDEIWGGQFVLASPRSKFWGGTRSPRPPVITPMTIYFLVAPLARCEARLK